MIEFQGVTKDYDGHLALNHLNLTIEDGQIVGLIGHNGAGKSTTIKSLVSVITPTTGRSLQQSIRNQKENWLRSRFARSLSTFDSQ